MQLHFDLYQWLLIWTLTSYLKSKCKATYRKWLTKLETWKLHKYLYIEILIIKDIFSSKANKKAEFFVYLQQQDKKSII